MYSVSGYVSLTTIKIVDRTSELRKKGYVGRRLGPKQMTTDTAVRVTRLVVHEKGKTLPPPSIFPNDVYKATANSESPSPLGTNLLRRLPGNSDQRARTD